MVIGLSGVRMEFLTNRNSASRSSIFFITLMITDQNGRHDVLLPIDHNHYNFREEQNNLLGKIYPLEIFSKPIKYPKF